MTKKQITEFWETKYGADGPEYSSNVINAIPSGLTLLAILGNVEVCAEHDEIWAYLDNWRYLTENDIESMAGWNWDWDSLHEGFHHSNL